MNQNGTTTYIYEYPKNSIFKKVTVVISDNTPKVEEDKKSDEIKKFMDRPKSLGYSGLAGTP